jgi:ABC-2 type transport system ATP-binding protein
MKILTGYLQPDDGEATIGGADVVADPLAAQRKLGYLPESAPVYAEMTVQEYLQMMAALRGVPPERQRALLSDAIHATGLADRLVQPIGKLSKGYRQRVGIAQAIVHEPKVLILDEPTVGLDPNQIGEIRQLLVALATEKEGAHTIVLSTHILAEVEAVCRRVILINKGKKVVDAPLAELTANGGRLEDVFTRATQREEAPPPAPPSDAPPAQPEASA